MQIKYKKEDVYNSLSITFILKRATFSKKIVKFGLTKKMKTSNEV